MKISHPISKRAVLSNKQVFRFPLYVFLIALLPALRFYDANWELVSPGDLTEIIGLYLVGTLVLLSVAGWLLKSWGRAGIVVTPLLLVAVLGNVMGPVVSGLLMIVWLLLIGVMTQYSFGTNRVTKILNLTLVVFCTMSLGGIISSTRDNIAPEIKDLFSEDLPGLSADGDLPDIYFIVMDGLGQPGQLKDFYEVPRKSSTVPFLDMGFRVFEKSTVSYNQTSLSLGSTFNLATIQDLLKIKNKQGIDRRVLGEIFRDNRVVRSLKDAGYRIETFPSGYPLTRIDNPDRTHVAGGTLGFVSEVVLSDGGLPHLQHFLGLGPADFSFAMRRKKLNYIFDHLPEVAREDRDEPVFVFAHVLAPHPPFVFGSAGEPLQSRRPFTYSDGNHWLRLHGAPPGAYHGPYRDQAYHVLECLAEAVERILANSKRPPIIVIQGDHGPGGMLDWENPQRTANFERLGIFNAIYFPDGGSMRFPPDFPAINTFALLMNSLFDASWPVKRPEYYFSPWSAPYTFIPVSPEIPSKGPGAGPNRR